MTYSYILTDHSVTVVVEGKPITIQREDSDYEAVKTAIKEQDWELVKKLSDKETQIAEFAVGDISVKHGQVYFRGEEMHGYVVDKILQFINEGFDAEPLINFLTKLMSNPSKRCVDQLFSFLEHKNMPIDPDGDFYAYKAVKNDWTDKHSGTIDNSIGTVVEVPRNRVDDDHRHDCSYGLHAGSMQYVSGFGYGDDHIVIVKINPADVVAVPDYDTSKLRCCRYEVVSEFENLLPDTTYDHDKKFWDDEDEEEEICSKCDELEEDCTCETDDVWNDYFYNTTKE